MQNKIENFIFIGKRDPLKRALQGLKAYSDLSKINLIIFSEESEFKDKEYFLGSINAPNIFLFQGENKYNVIEKLKPLENEKKILLSNTILVSASSTTIFEKDSIDKFPHFNYHHGDIRKYRGSEIHYWAIMDEAKDFIVTLHKIEEELDSGNIILEKKFDIEEYETSVSLYDKSNIKIEEMSFEFFKKLDEQGLDKILEDSYSVELGRNYKRKDAKIRGEITIDMVDGNNDEVKNMFKEIRAIYFPDYRREILIKRERI